jgi:hypothetical protein
LQHTLLVLFTINSASFISICARYSKAACCIKVLRIEILKQLVERTAMPFLSVEFFQPHS